MPEHIRRGNAAKSKIRAWQVPSPVETARNRTIKIENSSNHSKLHNRPNKIYSH